MSLDVLALEFTDMQLKYSKEIQRFWIGHQRLDKTGF